MAEFHDILFPLPLAFGASGGPEITSEIVGLGNGAEYRNSAQSRARRRYNAGVGVKSLADVQVLTAFFEARRGAVHGFRFRDPYDHTVEGGMIGVGDGARTVFSLVKLYDDPINPVTRPITRPIPESLSVFIDGQAYDGWSFNNGYIHFDTPPADGVLITANFMFDVPVRFDMRYLPVSLETFGAGKAVTIPLVEIIDE